MVEGIITYNRYPNNTTDEMQGGGRGTEKKSNLRWKYLICPKWNVLEWEDSLICEIQKWGAAFVDPGLDCYLRRVATDSLKVT